MEEKKSLETALKDEKERTKKRLIALENEAKKVTAEKNEIGQHDPRSRKARPARWPWRLRGPGGSALCRRQ